MIALTTTIQMSIYSDGCSHGSKGSIDPPFWLANYMYLYIATVVGKFLTLWNPPWILATKILQF